MVLDLIVVLAFLTWAFVHMLGCKLYLEKINGTSALKSKSIKAVAWICFAVGPLGWMTGIVNLINRIDSGEFSIDDKVTTPVKIYAILPVKMTNGIYVFLKFYYAARVLDTGFYSVEECRCLLESPIVKFATYEEMETHFWGKVLMRYFPLPDKEFLDAAYAGIEQLMDYAWAKRALGKISEDPDAKEPE